MNSNLREVTEGCFKETDFFEKGELWGTYLVQVCVDKVYIIVYYNLYIDHFLQECMCFYAQ